MINCPSCGEENPPKFRLCGYCGTPLAAAAALPAQEVRKTVTIVFSDLKDSTALGERVDAEALHEIKQRYFSAMSVELTRHGGRVEKYIGDAIMAVFGLPRAHEDDALRAVRAASGMRAALVTTLNDRDGTWRPALQADHLFQRPVERTVAAMRVRSCNRGRGQHAESGQCESGSENRARHRDNRMAAAPAGCARAHELGSICAGAASSTLCFGAVAA